MLGSGIVGWEALPIIRAEPRFENNTTTQMTSKAIFENK
jgi:hypothetical protein